MKELTKKEREILDRMLKIGVLYAHTGKVSDTFKTRINAKTEDEECELQGWVGMIGSVYPTRGGEDSPDDAAKLLLKWILHGRTKDFHVLQEWWQWRTDKCLQEIRENREQIERQIILMGKDVSHKKIHAEGYVYVLRSRDKYKVGRTKNPTSRLKQYTTENPHGIEKLMLENVVDMVKCEQEMIESIKTKQIRGEWFGSLDDTDIAKLKGVVSDYAV